MSPAGGGGGYSNSRSPPPACRLLEVTVISAQDLHRRSRRVRAYAAVWTDAKQKLRTRVDGAGRTDPTWNDRFVFRVDDDFLLSDMAAVTVAVHAASGCMSLRPEDPVLGVTRIVVSTFLRPSDSPGASSQQVVTLQLRRPRSLRPQGMLNVAVALLDAGHSRSVPLYYARGSPEAFAVKDLMARPAAPLQRISEDSEKEQFPERQRASSDGWSGPLDAGASAAEQRERRALESKLEKWKTELSPDRREAEHAGSAVRRRRSFFLCGTAEWEK